MGKVLNVGKATHYSLPFHWLKWLKFFSTSPLENKLLNWTLSLEKLKTTEKQSFLKIPYNLRSKLTLLTASWCRIFGRKSLLLHTLVLKTGRVSNGLGAWESMLSCALEMWYPLAPCDEQNEWASTATACRINNSAASREMLFFPQERNNITMCTNEQAKNRHLKWGLNLRFAPRG